MKYRFLLLLILFPLAAQAAPSYKKVLKKWTKSDRVYKLSDFHAVVDWSVTYLDEEMIEAQARNHSKVYKLDSSESDQLLWSLQEKEGGQTKFFVSFYTPNRKFSDLKKETAHWDVRLKADGRTFRPTKIEKTTQTPLQEMYYPYILKPWATTYELYFDSTVKSLPKPWTLGVYGPEGHSELVW